MFDRVRELENSALDLGLVAHVDPLASARDYSHVSIPVLPQYEASIVV